MNYFIMVDDKFIDGIIDNAEAVSAGKMNRYFVRGDKRFARYVKHSKVEWVSNIWGRDFRKVLDSITDKDKIIVYWYDLKVGRLMLTVDKNIPLYVNVWGGEFYEEPFPYHASRTYDPITLQYVNKTWGFPGNWPNDPLMAFAILLWFLGFKGMIQKEFELKKKTIRRINYLLINPNTANELELIQKIYSVPRLTYKPHLVDQNFNLADKLRTPKTVGSVITVQIGNSATESNNHADCIEVLKKFNNEDIKIVLPLSYGSLNYARFVEKKCKHEFKNKCEFLEKFMPRVKYIKKLNEIDIAIIFTNRTQAFGNCIVLLTLGKKLYLKKCNPLWSSFQKIGVNVFDADSIKNLTFEEFSKPLTSNQIKLNIVRISKIFSKKQQLEYMDSLLN